MFLESCKKFLYPKTGYVTYSPLAYKYLNFIILIKEGNMITDKIGLRIKELRNSLGLSQEKLALKAEIDRTYLAGIEQGKRNPSIKSLEKIIDALEVTFGEFFEDM